MTDWFKNWSLAIQLQQIHQRKPSISTLLNIQCYENIFVENVCKLRESQQRTLTELKAKLLLDRQGPQNDPQIFSDILDPRNGPLWKTVIELEENISRKPKPILRIQPIWRCIVMQRRSLCQDKSKRHQLVEAKDLQRQTRLGDCLSTISVLMLRCNRDTRTNKMARQDQDKTSNFLSRQIQNLQDKTETQIFMSL
ncbi:hypothetical protein PROFUN_15884 [Planoprotostelium fungivorum]|uniref:Uncharacterized protein n=1 Tax=Planoprotostelium fungivorum TaxID=1890364 RepID=A0A2P6MU92_9EUKA|nr:hypothetical protein PROFUN_15884 [Planoprotostelium fungivorum]